MGMNITPLTRPEVPLTTSNLIVNSDLSMMNYNLQANNVHVDGSILRVVECIPSDDVYTQFDSTSGANEIALLGFSPSTYYTGSIRVWTNIATGSGLSALLRIYNIDGTTELIDFSTTKKDIVLKDGTIAVYMRGYSGGTQLICNAGWTNNYLPLPTPPEIL